jgi:hypothetical protein
MPDSSRTSREVRKPSQTRKRGLFSIGALMDKQAALEADPSRNDYSFAKLTALFDKVGIDLLCGDNICIAAGFVSV